MRVFLDDDQPDATPARQSVDSTTDASCDLGTLSPQLKQILFIGDGVNSKGEAQKFVVPKGATRLFLQLRPAHRRPEKIVTVK